MQQGDFEAMYKALEGRPMTIRYLDPPLHEFLPHTDMTDEIEALAEEPGHHHRGSHPQDQRPP